LIENAEIAQRTLPGMFQKAAMVAETKAAGLRQTRSKK
jgi:hypothetical protein